MWAWFKRNRVDRAGSEGALATVAAGYSDAPPRRAETSGMRMRIGRPARGWRLSARYAVDRDEIGDLALAAGGYQVYLDLTDWIRPQAEVAPPPAAPERSRTVERAETAGTPAVAEAPDRNLTITLPKRRLMGLTLGLLNLTDEQLARIGWTHDDRTALTNPLIASTEGAADFRTAPDHMRPTLPRSGWARIMAVLASWTPHSPEQEELRADLRTIIGAEMARSAT